jgi:5,10-methylenetetrahydromethanopterin reductase
MTEPVRVHLRVPGTAPMPELMALLRDIEAAGFDGAGILDSQMISRDTFVVLGQAAGQTSRMSLFPAVTNPFTRHASVLAGAIQTVEEMAPGRVKFVIGTGYTSASTIGRKPATLAEMRAVYHRGEDAPRRRGRGLGRRRAHRARLCVEAAHPDPDGGVRAARHRAGRRGGRRGALARGLQPRHRRDRARAPRARGRRAGRRLEDLEIVWAVRTGTAATLAEARRLARPTAVHWGILRWGGQWLEPAGLHLPPLEIPDAVRQIYPDLSHAQDWDAAIRATSFVPDDVVGQLCDAMGLIGTPEHCADRIAEMTALGVRNLYLMPFQTFVGPEQEVRAFRDVVFPRLRAAGLR